MGENSTMVVVKACPVGRVCDSDILVVLAEGCLFSKDKENSQDSLCIYMYVTA
jgi:hypothetical protein